MVFLKIASTASSSDSKIIAGPEKDNPSFPVILATAPSGARLPFKILM